MSSGINPDSERILGLAAEILMRQGRAQAAAFLASVTSMSHRQKRSGSEVPSTYREIDLAVPPDKIALWPRLERQVEAAFDAAWPVIGLLSVKVRAESSAFDPDWRKRAR